MGQNTAKSCLKGIVAIILCHVILTAVAKNTFPAVDNDYGIYLYVKNTAFIFLTVRPYNLTAGVTIGEGVGLHCDVWSWSEDPVFMKWEHISDAQNNPINGSVLECKRTPNLLTYNIANYTAADAGIYQCTVQFGNQSSAQPKIDTIEIGLRHNESK